MLRVGTPYQSVRGAQSAYRAGRLSKAEYNDAISVLKVVRRNRITALKRRYEAKELTRRQYNTQRKAIDVADEGG